LWYTINGSGSKIKGEKTMKITIYDVAKKSGYGVGTVSRALRKDSSFIKEKTRREILRVANKLGYVINSSARSLASGKSHDIGLLIPAVFDSIYYNEFYMKIISGIVHKLQNTEYKLRVLFLPSKIGFEQLISEVHSLKLGGFILSPFCHNFLISKKDILKFKMPVIVIGKHIRSANIRSVILDDYKAGYDGTTYLIEKGHTDIGIIRGFREDIEDRYKGYLKALRDNDIEMSKEFIIKGDAESYSGYTGMKELMKSKKKPTAIFCLDDEMAFGALEALNELGIRCPEKVSVLGFDGLDAGEFTYPSLTTLRRPVEKMGSLAVDALFKIDKSPRSIVVEAEMLERKSCKKMGK